MKNPAASCRESPKCKEIFIVIRSLTPQQSTGNALAVHFHGRGIKALQQLAKARAFIESTIMGILPNEFGHDPAQLAQVIRAMGPEHCIVSPDPGQPQNPLPIEGM